MNQRKLRTGASVAAFDGEKVLLALRGKEPMKGFWSLPGGGVELGEMPIEAAKRELLEETGLLASNLCPVTEFHPHRIVDGRLVESDIIIHVFATTEFCGVAKAGDDAADIQWIEWNQLDSLQTTPRASEVVTLAYRVAFTES